MYIDQASLVSSMLEWRVGLIKQLTACEHSLLGHPAGSASSLLASGAQAMPPCSEDKKADASRRRCWKDCPSYTYAAGWVGCANAHLLFAPVVCRTERASMLIRIGFSH